MMPTFREKNRHRFIPEGFGTRINGPEERANALAGPNQTDRRRVDMAAHQVRQRSRECKNCGAAFTYEVGKGLDRTHCGAECREAYKASRRLPKALWPICRTEGCARSARSQRSHICNSCYLHERKARAGRCGVHKCQEPAVRVGHGLCERHYARVRKTGAVELVPRISLMISRGYRIVKDAGHPLAMANGWVAEHRLVAFAKYGSGSLNCHWCDSSIEWPETHVDHLNEIKDDNRPENLVVACSRCNRARGAMKPFIAGIRSDRIADLVATFAAMKAVAPTKAEHAAAIQREEQATRHHQGVWD